MRSGALRRRSAQTPLRIDGVDLDETIERLAFDRFHSFCQRLQLGEAFLCRFYQFVWIQSIALYLEKGAKASVEKVDHALRPKFERLFALFLGVLLRGNSLLRSLACGEVFLLKCDGIGWLVTQPDAEQLRLVPIECWQQFLDVMHLAFLDTKPDIELG